MFSEVMRGAPHLYNRMLSEELEWDEQVAHHAEQHAEWVELLDREAVEAWSLDELFAIARGQGGHRITPHAERFVRRWVGMVREDPARVPERADARGLIRQREQLLKGSRSLFRNRRALEERYGGALGLVPLSYRWPDVQVLLRDLYDGLERS